MNATRWNYFEICIPRLRFQSNGNVPYDYNCLILCYSQLLEAIQLTYFICSASAPVEGKESCPRTAQSVTYEASHFLYLGLEKSDKDVIANYSQNLSLILAFGLYAVLNQIEQLKIYFVVVFLYR